MIKTMYDPPMGWKFGFPKVYDPLSDETLEETLQRDGYPEFLIARGMAKYCRFYDDVYGATEDG